MSKDKTLKEEDEELYELSENLRLQLVVFELQDKVKKKKYKEDKESKINFMIFRTSRIILTSLYSILVIFEKPIHCFQYTTFYTNKNKTKNNNICDENLQYLNEDLFMEEISYRTIELFFLISFVILKIVHFRLKKMSLITKINRYIILQYIIFGIIFVCFIDIALGMIFNWFPLINFFLRGILIILLIKSQRNIWSIVLRIFYQTRVLTFLIFCVMIFFGIVGYFLFSKDTDKENKDSSFNGIIKSIYSLFILLSTCNFPDVMLETFTDTNKFSFFYFLLYLAINYFILFTLLKTLYYSEFFDSFKANARKAIEEVFDEFHKKKKIRKKKKKLLPNENNKRISLNKRKINEDEKIENCLYNNDNNDNNDINENNENNLKSTFLAPVVSKKFNKLIFDLNKQFYLTKNDYIKILKLIGYKGKIDDFTKNDIYQLLNETEFNKRQTKLSVIENSHLVSFFANKYTEIVINIIDFVLMILLLIEMEDTMSNFLFILIPQIVWCFFFVFEFLVYLKYFSFKYILAKEFILFLLFIINCIILLNLLFAFISIKLDNENLAKFLIIFVKVVISLRMLRIFLLFKKYHTFEAFSRTFHNMKQIFYGLFSALFSFYYIFITITMFLTGGKMEKEAFKDELNIPDNYANINFNDFGSGFLSCFCLTMINNINIISISLSHGCSSYFQGYFALFYFISTLVILNISTTLLLEMYMSIQAKMKEIQNRSDETDDEEMNLDLED